ncbi:hypothetical protein X740_26835 [Mesorhizobium sp. LNHC221B00]|nr:hypothetical protein X740_26835 [Mesorhizobium sp. LNHC221B00]
MDHRLTLAFAQLCLIFSGFGFWGGLPPPHLGFAEPSLPPPEREEGAMPAKLALFLYPVDRGRGVERSSTEWGSTAHR